MTDVVVLDLETTGLSTRRSQVIEVGAVLLRDGRAQATYHALARPIAPIPPSESIHGITDEMVADSPPFDETLPALLEFLGDRPIAAHHARFDVSFLAAAARRMGCSLDNEVWCTVRLSRRLMPEEARHDLDSLCVSLAIRRRVAHRALPDAQAAAKLLLVLLARAEEKGWSEEDVRRVASPGRALRAAPARVWTDTERDALEQAITMGDRIELGYVSRRGRVADRVVIPYRVHGPNELLLVAYDLAAGRTRTFRLDRVATVRAAPWGP